MGSIKRHNVPVSLQISQKGSPVTVLFTSHKPSKNRIPQAMTKWLAAVLVLPWLVEPTTAGGLLRWVWLGVDSN